MEYCWYNRTVGVILELCPKSYIFQIRNVNSVKRFLVVKVVSRWQIIKRNSFVQEIVQRITEQEPITIGGKVELKQELMVIYEIVGLINIFTDLLWRSTWEGPSYIQKMSTI